MSMQDTINEIVAKTSRLQDTNTRIEIVAHLQTLLESPKFKAMSALDVVQSVLAKCREGQDDLQG